MARVEKARQYITITEAPLFPWADYSGSVSKGSNYTGGSIAQTTGTTLTPGAIDAGISWELDIWGKTRRMTEAARADYLASEEGQRALMLSCSARWRTPTSSSSSWTNSLPSCRNPWNPIPKACACLTNSLKAR